MKSTRRYGAAALVAAATLTLSACNGSSKPSAAATTSTSPTAPAAATSTAAAAPSSAAPTSAAPTSAAPTSAAPTSAAGALPSAVLPTDATTTTAPPSSAAAPATSAAAPPPAAGGGARCTDLTNALASAALGKATTVKADAGSASLPGLSICTVTITGEIYPVQLDLDTTNGDQLYSADKNVQGGKDLSGVGDKAFTSDIGVEALAKGADIKVVGPAGPVLSGNFAVPTALAKAMAAALH